MSFNYKENTAPFVEYGGKSYNLDEVLIALAKAVVKNTAVTKQDILDEL